MNSPEENGKFLRNSNNKVNKKRKLCMKYGEPTNVRK